MTISSTVRRAGPYATDGVQTSFPFAFKVFNGEDVQVTQTALSGTATVLVLNTDYTVTLNADQEASPGGTVITTSALDDVTISIISDMGIEQPAVFTNSGGFYPRVLNDSLDRRAIVEQQLEERLDRAVLRPLDPAALVGKYPVVLTGGDIGWSAGTTTDAALRTDLASTSGSSLVGFIQAGAGAVARTAQAKMRDVVSAADFGASPSATAAANVTAFQAALDTGRSVFIPGGTYNLNAKLTSTGKAVSIVTDGAAILQWVTGSATQGLDFTFTNLTTHTLSIGDIELVTACEGGGTALKAVWPDGPTGYNRLMTFGRVMIRGADIPGQVGYWSEGIDTTNAWGAYGEALDFYGKASGSIPLSNSAWIARGHTTEARCSIHARYAKAMLRLAGFSEGFDLSGSIAVACDYGIDCDAIMSGLNTPQVIWIGGHAACFKGCIRSVNLLQGNISHILVYKRNDSAQNFIGFDLDSASTEWQITDCKVFSLDNPGGGTTTAVKDAGVNNITTNLRTVGCNTDVNIVAGASGFQHTFSRSDNTRGAITQGDTDGQVICLPGGSFGGSTSYFDTLAANSATPSILGYRKWGSCGHFLTANTVATTITNFTGSFPGDEFVLQANDANTTVQHNAGMQLNGGANKVLASAETIRLRRVTSTVWKQI